MLSRLINWFRSSLLKEVDGELYSALWPRQIYQVIASQKQRALTSAEAEQLLCDLQQYFQKDEVTCATLAADVKVLCFFVRLRFSAEPITSSTLKEFCTTEPLVSTLRYNTLVQHLLAAELNEWQMVFSEPTQVSLSLLRERLSIIQLLRYLEYPLIPNNQEMTTLPLLNNLKALNFSHWFYQLLSTCWQRLNQLLQQWLFGSNFSQLLRLNSTEYVAVADNLLQLVTSFHEQLDKNQQTHLFKTLHQWYAQGTQYWAKQPYFFDSKLAYLPDGKRLWKDELQFIQQSLQQDLKQLTQWVEFAFKGAFMQLQVDEAQGINSYLLIYEQLQEKIRAFSIAAWAYRSRCEERLRTISSNKEEQQALYLPRLQTLDNRLQRLYSKFTGIVWVGFDCLSYPDQSGIIEDLKRCFVYLDTELQYLSSLTHWLHHSCYCCDATEGPLTYEMNQHLRAANYSPAIHYQNRETVLTLTDHVVQNLGPKAWDKCLRNNLHPDKHPRLAPIAHYGFHQIQSLQKQAKQLITSWQRGQWASAAPTNTPQLTSSEPFLQTEKQEEPAITRIEKPLSSLDLSVLDFKAEYIQKIKAKADLTKYPPTSKDFTYQLYKGQESEEDRKRWQLKQAERRVRRKQEKELAEVRGGKEKALQKLQRVVVNSLTKELHLILSQRRPSTTQEKAHALLNEVITAVCTKPEHEACQIALSGWQEQDLTNLLLRIIKDSDDMHELAYLLCLSQRMAESTEINPLPQARNQHGLFSEFIPCSIEVDNTMSPQQHRK
ncbi:hypothetical protein [Legionella sp.]|uniref:hypothetical protein n=1 Tax=Legionella sp. TaxID=459 RepID=UPI00321FE8BE